MPARPRFVLALDQGTTSTRAILFDRAGRAQATAQVELRQHFPRPGWVEHDPEEIWEASVAVCRQVLDGAGLDAQAVDSIGITNQRETTILWERSSGKALHRAIVWQDRRTADTCERLRADGHEESVQQRTGLLLDPYFSGTKLAWLLDEVPGARAAAERGDLAFGTVECWLLWRLTGGTVHATDASNASRTLLFDLHAMDWSDEMLERFGIPAAVLPTVVDNAGDLGLTTPDVLGAPVPITGMAGDQQAATFGQACFEAGMIKSTYGTGCFLLLNTGDRPVASRNRLLTTVGWRIPGQLRYALEGSIFSAGATVQWLRDGLELVEQASQTQALAEQANPAARVYLVPAFTGLGAPWWDAGARGALLGLTRDSGIPEIARAALESVGFQTRDLMEAMQADGAEPPTALRVDGGMVASDWAMQFLADQLGVPVERPQVPETTALGAASLAGLHTGFFTSQEAIASGWNLERRFEPGMAESERADRYQGWRDAVRRVLSP